LDKAKSEDSRRIGDATEIPTWLKYGQGAAKYIRIKMIATDQHTNLMVPST
jgi:hypothetical protein